MLKKSLFALVALSILGMMTVTPDALARLQCGANQDRITIGTDKNGKPIDVCVDKPADIPEVEAPDNED